MTENTKNLFNRLEGEVRGAYRCAHRIYLVRSGSDVTAFEMGRMRKTSLRPEGRHRHLKKIGIEYCVNKISVI